MMLGVSSRTRSRNATAYQSLDDKGKRVFKNDQRKKAKLDVEKGNNSEVEGSGTNIDKGDTFISNNAPGSVAGKPVIIIIDSDSNSESDDVNANDGDANGGDVNGSDDDVNGGDDDGLYSSSDERGTSDDDSDGLCSLSDESGTSDEDFEGSESSSSEESFSSYDDEKEEEHDDDDDVVVVKKVKKERCTRDGVSERNYENVDDDDDSENSPLSVDDDECGVEDQKELQHAECATPSMSSNTLLDNTACSENGGSIDSSKLYEEAEKKSKNLEELWKEMEEQMDSPIGNIGTNEATPEKKGFHEKKGVKRRKNEVESGDDDVQVIEKKTCIEKGDCFDSSELFKGSEKNGVKRVITEVESDDDVQVIEVKALKNRKKKEYRLRSRQNVEPVLEELGDSTKVQNSQTKNANANEKVDSHVRKVHNARTDRKYDGDSNVKSVGQFKPKELRFMKLLAECYWDEKNSKKKESIEQKEKDGADLHKVDARPPACAETLPSKWSLEEKPKPPEKSKTEMELDALWEEALPYINVENIYPLIGKIGADEATPKKGSCEYDDLYGEHELYEDEEIGIYCKRWGCGFVMTESKNISPPVVDRFPYEGSGNRVSDSEVKGQLINEFQPNDHDGDSEAVLCHKEGTVWDLIPPDVKESLYPHQQEGFEFIWKNLAGNIDLNKLESPGRCSEGGCIICHYPGTGKTRLTIMFLKSYLKKYPKCRPVIVAPASLMLTWEHEFKKWDIGVPFHNLRNPELSGKELREAVDKVDWSIIPLRDTKVRRMVKLYSWYKEKSILGISYNLYAQLAGSKTRKRNEFDLMGKILREDPHLLVLDEGHNVRNEKTGIWEVLTKVKAKKRIMLSGTPFQNNFKELYHTLIVVKKSFPDTIPQELKRFCRSRKMQEMKPSEEWSWEPISSGNAAGNLANDKISQLKSRMDSFVHVHSGSILKKKLPGLRKCVLTLKPDSLQKQILDSIESSQDRCTFEYKFTLVSVHPSLFLDCAALTEKEESVLDKERLAYLRLKPYGGVKTKFLVEFVRLCDRFNEKVIVFSQFIHPLELIIEQLKYVFGWSEGKEVLYVSGDVNLNTKQSRIDTFNDPNSKAKIMLASTTACNEGISLVGASRVVLLDVVWNPSVERQAISRAYRIGQQKIVYTYHLITEGTTEWKKYGKQAEKERLSELVFSDKDAAENDVPNNFAVNFEDRVLEIMTRHENLKYMFA